MAADDSRSGPLADSYIGSLISLTSKCEIRYEGLLYNINPEESSIGLRNVLSFGTEGRKRDGPQVPSSEKVYEFILFRGSDIKDLQVKSSPPVQTAPIHNDPAIIQSHYSPMGSASTPAGNGPISYQNSHAAQLGHPRSTFQGGLPLYQPEENIESWGSTPPVANGSGLGIPMYWQGFYAPMSGLSHFPQPPLLSAPPGLSIPHSLPQHVQFSNINSLFPPGTLSLHEGASPLPLPASSTSISVSTALQHPNRNSLFASTMPSFPEFPSPLTPPASCTPSFIATSLPTTAAPTHASLLASESSLNLLPNRPLVNSHPASVFGLNIPLVCLGSINAHGPSVPKNNASILSSHSTESAPSIPFQTISQSMPSITSFSSSIPGETTLPLVTPSQLQHPCYSILPSSLPVQTIHDDAKIKAQEPKINSKSETLMCETPPPATYMKDPILPLPKPAHRRPTEAASHAYYRSSSGRGRGRGNAFSEPVTSFTEDFDFMAMHEKFNKDEVWGHLGNGKPLVKYDEREGKVKHANGIREEDEESLKLEIKPVYRKDDFFDKLSCNTLNRGTQVERGRFSEQLKIDTETFGDFRRHRLNRGRGRGFRGSNGGRWHGSYYGRGNGFNIRGRGHVT